MAVIEQSVCIRIPAYNDLHSLKEILNDIDNIIAPHLRDFSIFIFDDGSKDGSWKFLKEEAKRRPNLEIGQHVENKGFGPTLQKIFGPSSKELNFFIPGDNQFPVANFFRLYEALGDSDAVYGIREERADNLQRLIVSQAYNQLIRLLFSVDVRDVNSIFLCRSSAQQNISLKSMTAFVHAEFFLKLVKNGAQIHYAPIEHRSRMFGKGGGARINVVLSTLWELLKYRSNL